MTTTMAPETLAALKGSIRKWQNIIDGKDLDRGMHNCHLCQKFAIPNDTCEGCPVYTVTHQERCRFPEFDVWHRERLFHLLQDTDEDCEARKAAAGVRDFLISLLPPGETP